MLIMIDSSFIPDYFADSILESLCPFDCFGDSSRFSDISSIYGGELKVIYGISF